MYSNYYSLINSVHNDKVRFSQIFPFDLGCASVVRGTEGPYVTEATFF